ncbi:MAG TPA: hypothetical protein VEU47_18335 [Candidatus Cybelea sp.]|jgi:hypothetical protein|nr:hypothetical protein [Candidatus Cybelea sp.]
MPANDPNARLAPREFESLKEVAKGIMQLAIPAQHKAALIKLGFIEETSGRLLLTEIGKIRVAAGR